MAGGQVTPLVVTATMRDPVEFTFPIMLDGLLVRVVADRLRSPRPTCSDECRRFDTPIALEPGGRFHLASEAHHGAALFSRVEHIHKRAPVHELMAFGVDKLRRVDIKSGPDKGWRVPRSGEMFSDLHWWCVGDAESIRELLLGVTRLGARRRHGCGAVRSWIVDPCEPWDGFPVLREGMPLRPLPLDFPGASTESRKSFRNLTYPYFMKERAELLLCP
jgi:hypothetical protein